MAIMVLLSIASFLATTAVTIGQLDVANKNEDIKSALRKLVSSIQTAISGDRTKVNKLLSLANANNQTALMQYLQHNPIIAKTLEDIKSDSSLIASLQSEQAALENDLSSLQTEASQLGYNTDIFHPTRESRQAQDVARRLNDKQKQYSNFVNKVEQVNFSTDRTIKPYTADIDARAQNINGGMNK